MLALLALSAVLSTAPAAGVPVSSGTAPAAAAQDISGDEPAPSTTAQAPVALSAQTTTAVTAPETPPSSVPAAATEKKDGKTAARKEPEPDPDIASSVAISSGPAMRAVHLTAWVAGAPKSRRAFLDKLKGTVVNTVVVPLKETDGRVYVPGVKSAAEYGTYEAAIPDPEALLRDLRAQNLKAVARIVVFRDELLSRKHPEWAVRNPEGGVWRNQNRAAWMDPYRKVVWDYNLDLAVRAAELGFDEIQFDYIRFPTEGNTRACRYVRSDHSRNSAISNLVEFLRHARRRIDPTGKPISIAVFGMTTTSKDDMGIGQEIDRLAPLVDYISPMMYPSHYYKGEYGLASPNREPYKIIHRGLRDAKSRLKEQAPKLRPYLQDFSLFGVRYGPQQVKAQILAAHLQGVESWILWNASNNYTWSVLTPQYLGLPPTTSAQ
ncbi:MAG: putative glycoside hydrolase [Elusimicrobiota bacterium]|jgi:hypothetical protein